MSENLKLKVPPTEVELAEAMLVIDRACAGYRGAVEVIRGKRYNPPQWFQVRRVLGPDGSQRLRVSVDGSESVPRAWFTIPGYWFQPVRVPEPPQVPAETEPPKETDS